jgi:hypothetical protein
VRLSRRTVLAGVSALSAAGHMGRAALPECGARDRPLSLWDFLDDQMRNDVAAGTLRVDCSTALQRALDIATASTCNSLQAGRQLMIPAGRYLVCNPIRATFRREANVLDDRDLRRPAIVGEGQANTELYFRGIGDAAAFRLEGNSSERREGTHLYLSFRGLRLQRDFQEGRTGLGLDLEAAAFVSIEDVTIATFGIAVRGRDVLRMRCTDMHLLGGEVGLDLRAIRYSHPNLISFQQCSFGGVRRVGAVLDSCANVSFDSCSFEGVGSGPQSQSLLVRGGPAEGGSSVRVENCYFENNHVEADVKLDWGAGVGGTAAIASCTFQQTETTRAPQQHLLLIAEMPARLMGIIESCGFKHTTRMQAVAPIVTRGGGVMLEQRGNFFSDVRDD